MIRSLSISESETFFSSNQVETCSTSDLKHSIFRRGVFKIRGEPSRLIRRISRPRDMKRILLILVLVVMLTPSSVSVARDVDRGADIKFNGAVQVTWKLDYEYSVSDMTDEVDNMMTCLKYDKEAVKNELEELLGQAVDEKCNQGAVRDVELSVESEIGHYTRISLSFDVSNIASSVRDRTGFDFTWKSLYIEGYIKVQQYSSAGTVVNEAKFYPYKTLGLDWGVFGDKLEEWDNSIEGSNRVYRKQIKDFPLAHGVSAYNVIMQITIPRDYDVEGNFVLKPVGTDSSTPQSGVVFGLDNTTLLLAVVGIVATPGILYATYRVLSGRGIELPFGRKRKYSTRLIESTMDRRIIRNVLVALEGWTSQPYYPRRRRLGWKGGTVNIRIPRVEFSREIRDYYLRRYVKAEEG